MKKGFTLVELLGVIVILCIIGMITVPLVQRTIIENNQKLCEDQVTSFERAARNYANKNVYQTETLITNSGGTYNITLSELQEEGFLQDGDIENPLTGENFNLNTGVNIKESNNQFSYEYDDPNACTN